MDDVIKAISRTPKPGESLPPSTIKAFKQHMDMLYTAHTEAVTFYILYLWDPQLECLRVWYIYAWKLNAGVATSNFAPWTLLTD